MMFVHGVVLVYVVLSLPDVLGQGLRDIVRSDKSRMRSSLDTNRAQDRCLMVNQDKEYLRQLVEGVPHHGHVTGSVVIVGAGMAGLTAAMLLEDIGIRVTILEASGRPGGRVQTFRKDGWYAEFGAMRIPWSHKIMLELMKQLDIQQNSFINIPYAYYVQENYFPADTIQDDETLTKLHTLYTNHKQRDTQKLEKAPNDLLDDGFSQAFNLIDRVGWEKAIEHLDEFSVETYFRKVINMTESELEMAGVFGLVEGLYYTSLVENIRDYCDLNDDGTYFEISGGTDKLVDALIEKRLRETKIVYNAAVSHVDQTPCSRNSGHTSDGCSGNVRVTYKCEGIRCEEGVAEVAADFVIVTASAPVAGLIKYKPRLTREKVHAMRKVHYDNSVKIILVFSRPFWEEEGFFGGKLVSDLLVRATYYPSHKFKSGVGVLLASYVWGEDANKWTSLTDHQCIQLALADVVELHGEVARDTFKEGVVKKWLEDPLTMGAFAWPLPHQQPLLEHLRSPEGRIMFGGEHTDVPHAWIETAIKSGIRTASEVVAGLQQQV